MHVVKYLNGTVGLGLTFTASSLIELFAYIDASYNSHADTKGHTGICIAIGNDNTSFQSKSRKPKLVVKSSIEAEFLSV